MSRLCIIPARGGSKRIPRKNIKKFIGKPIIAYSIEAALNSELFDEVMVSTDDEEIADISKQYGAKTPFLRSSENSNDFATIMDVITEVTEDYKRNNYSWTEACCILPTAPFVKQESLNEACKLMKDQQFDSVFPVIKYASPIERSLRKIGDKIEMRWPENMTVRSQDLEPSYYDAGQFYWMTPIILDKKKMWTDNSGTIVINELEAHDIDSREDWEIAEFKYNYLLKKNEV